MILLKILLKALGLAIALSSLVSLSQHWIDWSDLFKSFVSACYILIDPVFNLVFGWIERLFVLLLPQVSFPNWIKDYLVLGTVVCESPPPIFRPRR